MSLVNILWVLISTLSVVITGRYAMVINRILSKTTALVRIIGFIIGYLLWNSLIRIPLPIKIIFSASHLFLLNDVNIYKMKHVKYFYPRYKFSSTGILLFSARVLSQSMVKCNSASVSTSLAVIEVFTSVPMSFSSTSVGFLFGYKLAKVCCKLIKFWTIFLARYSYQV